MSGQLIGRGYITIAGLKDGDPAKTYVLIPSVDSITKKLDGTLSVTGVTCSVYKVTGSSAYALTSDHTLSYVRTPDGAGGILIHAAGTSGSIAVLATTESIEFELKDGSKVIDRVRVPVLSDATDVNNELDTYSYLKEALAKQGTVADHGLLLTSLIALGYTDDNNVRHTLAGTNGIYVPKLDGRTIGSWWGGDMLDLFKADDTRKTYDELKTESGKIAPLAATSLVRMDGSAYFANGNIGFKADGSGWLGNENGIKWTPLGALTIGAGVTIDVTGDDGVKRTLTDVANFITAVTSLLAPADANGKELQWNQVAQAQTIMAKKTFFSLGGVSAKGIGSSTGGGGSVFGLYTDSTWAATPSTTDALGAVLGKSLHTRISALEGKNYLDELTLTEAGTGNAVTDVSLSNDKKTLTVTYGASYLSGITKAMVEGVLTGNITTHTHSQYLTSASLSGYYSKTQADERFQPKGNYVTNVTLNDYYTKPQIYNSPIIVYISRFVTLDFDEPLLPQSLGGTPTVLYDTVSKTLVAMSGYPIRPSITNSDGIFTNWVGAEGMGSVLTATRGWTPRSDVLYYNLQASEFYRWDGSDMVAVDELNDMASGGGLDESQLADYLTTNNYAKKSDIPSLSGYATQAWVTGKGYLTSSSLHTLTIQKNGTTVGTYKPDADKTINIADVASAATLENHLNNTTNHVAGAEKLLWNQTATKLNAILGEDSDTIINKWEEVVAFLDTYTEADTLANLLSNKVDKERGKGLSSNDFTDAMKLKLTGLNNYTLPTASADTLGGVKIGANITITNGVISTHAPYSLPTASASVKGGVKVGVFGGLKMDGETLVVNLSSANIPSLDWSKITSGKPTTLAGYGITDAFTKTDADGRFQPKGSYVTTNTAQTISGVKTFSGEQKFMASGLSYSDPWLGTACAVKVTGKVGVTDSIKALSFIKAGGTFTQVLMADGNVRAVWLTKAAAISESGMAVTFNNTDGGDSEQIVDAFGLSVWNGASVTAAGATVSRLAYCKHGAFGDIVTRNASEFQPKGNYVTTNTAQTISGGKTFSASIVNSLSNPGSWWTSTAVRAKFAATNGGNTSGWSPVLGFKTVTGKYEIGSIGDTGCINYYHDTRTANGVDFHLTIPKASGILATQEWANGRFLTSHQSLANYVTTNTAQRISGGKTFNSGALMVRQDNACGLVFYSFGDSDTERVAAIELLGASGSWLKNSLDFYKSGRIVARNSFTATSIIKSGGTSSQFLMADGSVATKHTLSSVTNLGWGGTSGQIVTINTLAYWNGQYTAGGSNLMYCDRGRFGTMATMDAADYPTVERFNSGVAFMAGKFPDGGVQFNVMHDEDEPGVGNIVNIPTKTSHLTNDSGFLTGSGADAKYVTALRVTGDALTWVKNGLGNNITLPFAAESRVLRSYGRITAVTDNTAHGVGVRLFEAYNNGYPTACGNVLAVQGSTAIGGGELLMGWSGTNEGHASLYYRNRRDTASANWSAWATILDSVNYSTTLDGRYLKKAGDTMTGELTIKTSAFGGQLNIFRNDTTGNSVIKYTNAKKLLGYIGIGGSGGVFPYEPMFSGENGTWYKILHSGNYAATLDPRYVNVSGDTMTGALSIEGKLSIGYVNDSYKLATSSFICNSWIRTVGGAGWYSETYGGGWCMTDSTWIRIYGGKSLYAASGIIRTDGELQVGGGGDKFRVTAAGAVTATSFTKRGGTASQLLAANGSVRNVLVYDDLSDNALDIRDIVMGEADPVVTREALSGWDGSSKTRALVNGAVTDVRESYLAYCNKGAFGTMATKNADDYVTRTTAQTISGVKTFSGEQKFMASGLSYSDPWLGTACAVKVTGKVGVTDSIKALSFIKAGGTFTQVLMADGNVRAVWLTKAAAISESGMAVTFNNTDGGDSEQIVDAFGLSVWNGASVTAAGATVSRLAYCKHGAFGDIVTRNASEFQPKGNYVTTNTAQTISGGKTFSASIVNSLSNPGSWWTSTAVRAKFAATNGGNTSGWSPVLGFKTVTGKYEIGSIGDTGCINYYHDTRTANGVDFHLTIPKASGILATQEWANGRFLTSHQSLANYVTTNTAQTVSGRKTFSDAIINSYAMSFLFNYRGSTPVANAYGVMFYKRDTHFNILRTKKGAPDTVTFDHGGSLMEIDLATNAVTFAGVVTASNISTSSDARLKTRIADIALPIADIAAAPLWRYRCKDTGVVDVGSTAQYWGAILPELTRTDEQGWMSLDYGKTALLASVSLARKADDHEARIKALEAENRALREKIARLEAA